MASRRIALHAGRQLKAIAPPAIRVYVEASRRMDHDLFTKETSRMKPIVKTVAHQPSWILRSDRV